jgi:hypothetical protein
MTGRHKHGRGIIKTKNRAQKSEILHTNKPFFFEKFQQVIQLSQEMDLIQKIPLTENPSAGCQIQISDTNASFLFLSFWVLWKEKGKKKSWKKMTEYKPKIHDLHQRIPMVNHRFWLHSVDRPFCIMPFSFKYSTNSSIR